MTFFVSQGSIPRVSKWTFPYRARSIPSSVTPHENREIPARTALPSRGFWCWRLSWRCCARLPLAQWRDCAKACDWLKFSHAESTPRSQTSDSHNAHVVFHAFYLPAIFRELNLKTQKCRFLKTGRWGWWDNGGAWFVVLYLLMLFPPAVLTLSLLVKS
jgi:hypothetical protein